MGKLFRKNFGSTRFKSNTKKTKNERLKEIDNMIIKIEGNIDKKGFTSEQDEKALNRLDKMRAKLVK